MQSNSEISATRMTNQLIGFAILITESIYANL
jgi:hypothetical protein